MSKIGVSVQSRIIIPGRFFLRQEIILFDSRITHVTGTKFDTVGCFELQITNWQLASCVGGCGSAYLRNTGPFVLVL